MPPTANMLSIEILPKNIDKIYRFEEMEKARQYIAYDRTKGKIMIDFT